MVYGLRFTDYSLQVYGLQVYGLQFMVYGLRVMVFRFTSLHSMVYGLTIPRTDKSVSPADSMSVLIV